MTTLARFPRTSARARLIRIVGVIAMLLVGVSRPIGAQGHVIWPWDQFTPGPAQPVVLVHGGNADASTWTSFASTLIQNGYFAIAPNVVAGDPIHSQADAVNTGRSPTN
ncbi:MAG: hypothetical protein LH467_15360 [Gemmatimonadaceae bacterium]|nr:hypothetical protein [Gemmatimonadaceae bacterium]